MVVVAGAEGAGEEVDLVEEEAVEVEVVGEEEVAVVEDSCSPSNRLNCPVGAGQRSCQVGRSRKRQTAREFQKAQYRRGKKPEHSQCWWWTSR